MSGIVYDSSKYYKKEVIEKSNIIELQAASDKIKFDKCKEASQLGYCCDAHPGCGGCDFYLSDEVYVSLGGKLRG